jgi:hypothetical protein
MNSRTLRIPFAFLQWLLVLYAVVACNKGKPAFEQFGEMRTVMSESQTHASVFLCAAYSAPYANSVGALADLDGEVTIADGQVWVTPNVGDKPVTSRPLCADGDRAILLSVGHMSSSIRFALAASALCLLFWAPGHDMTNDRAMWLRYGPFAVGWIVARHLGVVPWTVVGELVAGFLFWGAVAAISVWSI